MPRIMLTVAYDGTAYHGFAAQSDESVATIEGVLNRTISSLTGEETEVTGASRTDAGVHAYGNLAVFDTASRIPPERFHLALNRYLPEDIRVVASTEVAPDFHPRHRETRKTYEYRILNSPLPDPMLRLYTYHYRSPLDTDAMNEGISCLVGTHDYTAFCAAATQSESKVRTIYTGEVTAEDIRPHHDKRLITIRITGNGFLYNMVRIIAGTLIDVGRGHIKASSVREILESKDRSRAGATAPPGGLFLIGYEGE